MSRSTIINIPRPDDPQFNRKMVDVVDVWAGNRTVLDQVLTKRDIGALVPAAIATAISSTTGKSSLSNYPGNPGAPTNVSVITTGINSHLISWRNPVDRDLYYVELWCAVVAAEASAPVFANADRISVITEIGKYDQTDSITRADINDTYDYYYWLIAYDWAGNASSVAFVGSALFEDSPTIDNLVDQLKGNDPDEYNAATYYTYKQRVKYTDGTKVRRFMRTNYQSGAVNGQAPTGDLDDLYWDRIGILMEGEIDGENVVAIDGHLVVDGTIMASSIRGDGFGTLTISSGEVIIQTATGGLTVQSGGTLDILGSAGQELTMDTDGNINLVGTVTFQSGTSGYDNISDAPDLSGVVDIYYQSAEPSSGMEEGDIWIDSDDDQMYRYSGAAWVSIQDSDIASAVSAAASAANLADEKAHIYFQTTAPAGLGASDEGDLWFDTDDDLSCSRWNGSAWTASNVDYSNLTDALGIQPEDNATDNSSWEHASDETKIDGGEIYAGSLVTVGDPSNEHIDVTSGQIQFNDGATKIAYLDAVGFRSTVQPSVQVYLYSSQSGSGAGYETITWDTEVEDQDNNMSSTTFTAPATGRYVFTFGVTLTNVDSTNNGHIRLVTSNRNYLSYFGFSLSSTSIAYAFGSVVADMDSGDTAYLQSYLVNSDSYYIYGTPAAGIATYMSIHMLA